MRSNAARLLFGKLFNHSYRVALAESLTCGRISDLLGAEEGVSAVLWGAFICYSAEAKTAMLGIDPILIDRYGAVSSEVARAMAEGVLSHSPVELALAVTGLAGPTRDGSSEPIGRVWLAGIRRGGEVRLRKCDFFGDRASVRASAAEAALRLGAEILDTL